MRSTTSTTAFVGLLLFLYTDAHAQGGNIEEFTNPLGSQGLQIPDPPTMQVPDNDQPLPYPNSGAAAWDRAAQDQSRTFHQVGDEVGALFRRLARRQEMRQTITANNQLTQEDEIVLGEGPGSWNEAKASGVTASDYIRDTVEPALDKIGESVTSERAREQFSEERRSMLMDYVRRFSADNPLRPTSNSTSAGITFQRFDEWQKRNGKAIAVDQRDAHD